jgi:class 3 adenylate cyclase/uncharacterized RDD family membrane protein YckC
MNKIRSQNLSIMLTDIQGYSKALAEFSRGETVELIRRHNRLMKPVIDFYRGKIIKTIGDSFLCTFNSATDAVICAIIIQLLLREYNQKLENKEQELHLRVVINSGDVSLENNDIFGTAVNVTSRMEKLDCFPGGSIGISESTYLLMDKGEIFAEKIGPKNLKDIPEPVNVFRVPLEQQKLNKLPIQLLELVEKVLLNAPESNDANSANAELLSEWSESISGFLKKANWGDNIDKASKQFENVQKKLTKTIANTAAQVQAAQKVQLAQAAKGNSAPIASLAARGKGALIDLGVAVGIYASLRLAWWVAQPILFGKMTSVVTTQNLLSETINTKVLRPMGLIEAFINLNVHTPLVFIWLYFSVFLKFKNATIGQLIAKTSVLNEDGTSELSWKVAMIRSISTILSVVSILGMAMALTESRLTLHDRISKTKVIE